MRSFRVVVHIAAGRDTPRFSPSAEVKVYANVDSVELTVNGVSLGRRAPGDHAVVWPGVTLRPGTNTVVATGGGVTDRVIWELDTSSGATSVDVDVGGPNDHNASDGVVGSTSAPITGTDRAAVYRDRVGDRGAAAVRFLPHVLYAVRSELMTHTVLPRGAYRTPKQDTSAGMTSTVLPIALLYGRAGEAKPPAASPPSPS